MTKNTHKTSKLPSEDASHPKYDMIRSLRAHAFLSTAMAWALEHPYRKTLPYDGKLQPLYDDLASKGYLARTPHSHTYHITPEGRSIICAASKFLDTVGTFNTPSSSPRKSPSSLDDTVILPALDPKK